MRRVLPFLLPWFPRPPASHAGRPEVLRRRTLAATSYVLIGSGLICSPFGAYGLLHGEVLPFVVSILALCGGSLTWALGRRGQQERAAAAQHYSFMLVGLVLTIADPAPADFGLGVALLGAVQASLVARATVRMQAWVLLACVAGLAALATTGLVQWIEPHEPGLEILAALSFGVAVAIVAYAANRLNAAFHSYEARQMNAYSHLIENVQDAVMRFSAEGQLIFTSRSSEKLFGCRRFDLMGSGMLDRMHVLDRPNYLTAFADANVHGRARMVEVRVRRDDPAGENRAPQFFWVEVALSPVTDSSETAERFEVVALLRDVTARKDIETEMREARKLAEEASVTKSRFLATMGHELRTPLNAIVGFSEMMTSSIGGELSPAHREYANLIHQSGHHLIDVVRMLLDMSRIEAGKFELQTEPFPPSGIVDPCIQMVDTLARQRQVKVRLALPRTLPTLTADERACRQILINLLSNAIKFSHEGGEVVVSMKRQGRHLNISVTDQGIGMGADALARIGEPFFQAQDGLARRYEGTGLGLSIVKGLVDLHQGSLHARSVLGEGTTVTVLLPLNGPATKLVETPEITQLRPEPVPRTMAEWHDGRRKAQ